MGGKGCEHRVFQQVAERPGMLPDRARRVSVLPPDDERFLVGNNKASGRLEGRPEPRADSGFGLDRHQDGLYLAQIVYPEGRMVEFAEDYFKTTPIPLLILRAAYNHRDIDLVVRLAGRDGESCVKELDALRDREAGLENRILACALAMSQACSNQRGMGLERATALLAARRAPRNEAKEADDQEACDLSAELAALIALALRILATYLFRVSAAGGTRTPTTVRSADFKSAASTIPPRRQPFAPAPISGTGARSWQGLRRMSILFRRSASSPGLAGSAFAVGTVARPNVPIRVGQTRFSKRSKVAMCRWTRGRSSSRIIALQPSITFGSASASS